MYFWRRIFKRWITEVQSSKKERFQMQVLQTKPNISYLFKYRIPIGHLYNNIEYGYWSLITWSRRSGNGIALQRNLSSLKFKRSSKSNLLTAMEMFVNRTKKRRCSAFASLASARSVQINCIEDAILTFSRFREVLG